MGASVAARGYVVYERAANGARSRVGAAASHAEAVALAQEAAAASGHELLVCAIRPLRAQMRAVRVLEAVRPDGVVTPASSPLPAPTGSRPWRPIEPGGGWSPAVPRCPTLAVQELRAYVAVAGACAYGDAEVLRAALQRHLQDDDDLVESLLAVAPCA